MVLIVEDGTGLPDAEAYISVADADDYFDKRGNAAWTALSEPRKEAALRLGADYMGAAYGARWCGVRLTTTQALDWPRVVGGVPEAVRRANAEMAVRAAAGPLMADQGAAVKREKVDVLEVEYADGAQQSVIKYAAVDSALEAAGLLCRGGLGRIPVVRA